MKFSITIGGNSQPALIDALNEARKALVDGRCHINSSGSVEVVMGPADAETEAKFRRQHQAAHPRATAPWAK